MGYDRRKRRNFAQNRRFVLPGMTRDTRAFAPIAVGHPKKIMRTSAQLCFAVHGFAVCKGLHHGQNLTCSQAQTSTENTILKNQQGWQCPAQKKS